MAVNQWLSNDERFADLFNGVLFEGEAVIRPEELERMDRETDIIAKDQGMNTRGIQRYRDVIKRWSRGATLAVLACETQKKVHYAMPVRTMFYDSLSYMDQIREMWKQRRKEQKKGETALRLTEEEYLSRFCKDDKLYPVITLVFYYDTKKWDGAADLYDLFQIDQELGQSKRNVFQKYLPNYHINLVDAGDIHDTKLFHTDLQQIFGMLKCRGKKEELKRYIWENQEYFREIDVETYRALGALLQADNLMKDIGEMKISEKEGKIDMCQAMQEWYEEAIQEGRKEGREEGREEGARKITAVVKNMMRNGFSVGDIEKYTGITRKEIEQVQMNMGK